MFLHPMVRQAGVFFYALFYRVVFLEYAKMYNNLPSRVEEIDPIALFAQHAGKSGGDAAEGGSNAALAGILQRDGFA